MRAVAIALSTLALVPLMAVMSWGWLAERENLARRASDELDTAKDLVGAELARSIEGARQLLGTLAEAPALANGNWEACNVFLQRVGRRSSAYLTLSVSDVDGNVVCSSLQRASAIDLRGTRNFSLGIRAADFSVGEYTVGRISGIGTVPFSMPVRGPGGERMAVVFAAVNLRELQQRLGSLNLPEGIGAMVTDVTGVVLADATERGYRGVPPVDSALAAALAKGYTGSLTTTDARGHEVRHLIRANLLPGGGKLMHIASSSWQESIAPAMRRLTLLSVAGLVALALYVALLWRLAHRWIFRPLRLIGHDMHLIGADRYEGEAVVRNSFVREIDSLGRGLEAMWRALARRDQDGTRAQGEIDKARGAAHRARLATDDVRNEMWEVLNAMNDGFMVLGKDWSIRFCNTRGAEMLTREAPELIGLKFWTLFPGADNDVQRIRCERELAHGKTWSFEEFHAHHERWLELRFFQPHGEIGVFMLDSTQHWEMLDEVAEREKRYRELFDANPNMMIIRDAQTLEFLAVNAATLDRYGYSHEDFMQLAPDGLASPEDRGTALDDLSSPVPKHTAAGESRIYRHVTAHGEPLMVEVVRYPIVFNGRPALVAMATEVSKRLRIESGLRTELAAQIRKQGQTETTLAAYAQMVHAYGALLGREVLPLLGRVEGIGSLSGLPEAPKAVRGYVAGLVGETRGIQQLLLEVLRLAEVSRAPFRAKAFDLAALAAQVAAPLRLLRPDVSLEIQGRLPCTGEPALVRLLLVALIGNAWKFTAGQAGAWVRVGMTRSVDAGIATFHVADNGCGFDAEQHDRMFLPFESAHAQGQFDGHGIGLAIARAVVARHGGRIWGECRPGRGSTFFFELEPRRAGPPPLVAEVVIDSPPEDAAPTAPGQLEPG